MPEVLTKHPDVALQVLRSQGAQCGTGARPKILTSCPPEKFCTLAGGELCVYGAREIGQMTQLTRADVCAAPAPPRSAVAGTDVGALGVVAVIAAALLFGALRAWRARHATGGPPLRGPGT